MARSYHSRYDGLVRIPWRRIDWTNTAVLAGAHLLAVAAVIWMVFRFHWETLALAVVCYWFCGLSITGGYHRLFAHPTYRAAWPLKLFYLLFGAASVQNSALKWSSDHRRHHTRTDEEEDPYNIRKGFWWAHMGWVLVKEPEVPTYANVKDLQADPLVRFQHRFYVPLALLVGWGLPTAVAALWGDPWGGLLVAGFLRLTIQYHATFSINSVAHWTGTRPYDLKASARDSAITALITFGEGYHNFHHRFPLDYRNGVRFYHFDPTKWWVWSFSCVGLVRELRRTSAQQIATARQTAALTS